MGEFILANAEGELTVRIYSSQVILTESETLFEPPYLQFLHCMVTIEKRGLLAYKLLSGYAERMKDLPQDRLIKSSTTDISLSRSIGFGI